VPLLTFPETHSGGSADGLKHSHNADLDWHTIIPSHSGERLDLHEAIWICFANAKARAIRRELEQHAEPR